MCTNLHNTNKNFIVKNTVISLTIHLHLHMGGPKGGGIAGSTSATPTSGVYSGTAIQGIQS